ncbi:MAG: Xaa-Pro peptidase family protein [Planctomycetota bacterium]
MTATLLAGIPATNMALYHRCRFVAGDPAAWVKLPGETVFICRNIEVDRARKSTNADRVIAPADVVDDPSGERDVMTAQAVVALLRDANVGNVVGDRSLGLVYVDVLREAGIEVRLDRDLGVADRRSKDADELTHLRHCQSITERAMRTACEHIARADADTGGHLHHDGTPVTSDSVRALIELLLIDHGMASEHGTIVAGLPHCADCHDRGEGPLRTGEPVIIDIFPRDRRSLYWGDCTRTVVHGTPTPELAAMHAAVVESKAAAIATIQAGVTGAEVHAAAQGVIHAHGFDDMVHGTGHGVGLDVHEAPLLDAKGGPLVAGDVLTIEPGLYHEQHGGVRVEDMVVVTDTGHDNFNTLPESLAWKNAL